MASLKAHSESFAAAVGPRRYVLPSMVVGIAAVVNYAAPRLGGLIDANGPFAYLPLAIGLAIAALLIIYWLLTYASELRAKLKGITEIEKALDDLSTHFDEGNNEIFNAFVASDEQFFEWDTRWKTWQKIVEEHLESNFGLRERNIFRNLVLVEPYNIQGS